MNRDLDLGRVSFLWMSFEAVSCGLRLRPTRVEWRWDRLHEMKESLTGVWHVLEWIPFKTLSYRDESSTVYRYVLRLTLEMIFCLYKTVSFHRGRERKIKPGQKLHSSIAFCDESYRPKAILPQSRCLYELVGKARKGLSNRDWVEGWEDLIEMDIFDLSLMSNVIENLKSRTGTESHMWVYRLTTMTSTGGNLFYVRIKVSNIGTLDEGQNALRNRPNIVNDLVQIFTHTNHQEVRKCVTAILEKSSKGHGEQVIIYSSPEIFSKIL